MLSLEGKLRAFKPQKIPLPKSQEEFPLDHDRVDIEIGCGVGFHPILRGSGEPERVLMAIEHTRTRFSKLVHRLEGHPHVRNVIPVFDDAVSWITHRVPQASVGHIFLLYPNPYPKHAQRNKRWFNMPFMGYLLERLHSEGTLTIATNEVFYCEEARSSMVDTWNCVEREYTELVYSKEMTPRTHFEKKYLERGETCFNMVFQRPKR